MCIDLKGSDEGSGGVYSYVSHYFHKTTITATLLRFKTADVVAASTLYCLTGDYIILCIGSIVYIDVRGNPFYILQYTCIIIVGLFIIYRNIPAIDPRRLKFEIT